MFGFGKRALKQKMEAHFEILVIASVTLGIHLGPNYKERLAKTTDRWLRGYCTGYASFFISEDLWRNEEARIGLLYFFLKQLLGDSLADPLLVFMAREADQSPPDETYRYGSIAGREEADAFTARKEQPLRLMQKVLELSPETGSSP